MKTTPKPYSIDQSAVDMSNCMSTILLLAERVKDLEDTTQDMLCSIVDIGLDLHSLPDPIKFGGVLTRFVLKHVPFKDLRRFQRFRSELTKAQEEIEGLRNHYTSSTLPSLEKINELLEKKVGKQEYTIKDS